MISSRPTPKLSIWMIAYDHEDFIAQALESILMQEVDFDYEIVIGEDCSTDNTRKIIREYEAKYPIIIKPIYHEKNIGLHQNVVQTLEACSGKYIALLEGDDYWTDPLKLQKQVDFLESNSSYSMCCHATEEVEYNGVVYNISDHSNRSTYDLAYMIKNDWFIRTASIVFRRDAISNGFPDFFYKNYSTDYILQLLILNSGNCFYFKDRMSAYRRHSGGISVADHKTRVQRWVLKLKLLDDLNEYFDNRFIEEVNIHKLRIKKEISFNLLRYPILIKELGFSFFLKYQNPLFSLEVILSKLK